MVDRSATTGESPSPARRPLRSRQLRPIRGSAAWLARRRVRPNLISVASVAAAVLAGVALVLLPHESPTLQVALLVAAAAGIQLRLLANVLDGLVAVEGGLHSPEGVLYNEVPDRIADVVIIAATGYAVVTPPWSETVGWLAAMLAVFAAYVRQLGGALGFTQDFAGPMAKQQRMALLTAALACSIGEVAWVGYEGRVLSIALVVMALGTSLTAARRLRRIAHALKTR